MRLSDAQSIIRDANVNFNVAVLGYGESKICKAIDTIRKRKSATPEDREFANVVEYKLYEGL